MHRNAWVDFFGLIQIVSKIVIDCLKVKDKIRNVLVFIKSSRYNKKEGVDLHEI